MEQKNEYDKLGKYELLERLGQGGMGEVWKARDTQLQRYVAIKLLRSELEDNADFVAYFMREARLVAALRHPNIVQIHDFQSGGAQGRGAQAYMVMDYIEGGTLARVMRETVHKGIFWSSSEIVDLFTAISLALDYAHSQGMVHRDIKPENILLDRSRSASHLLGTPVLTDFGIARWQGGSSTLTGFVGTPMYISPEQAQSLPVDARSDLYSLGIVLYEALAGDTPFHGNSPLGVMLQHIDMQPPAPSLLNPLVTPALEAVVFKSLAKDPRARFPSATAMTIALAQAFSLPVPALLEHARGNALPAEHYNPLQPASPSSLPGLSVHEMGKMTTGEATRLTPANLSFQPAPTLPASPWQPVAQAPGMPQTFAPGTGIARPQALPERRAKGTRKPLLVASLIGLLVVLLGLGVTVGPRLFSTSGTPTAGAGNQVAGEVRFLSTNSAAPGVWNSVEITVNNVSAPPAGQTYYAWLTQADSEAVNIPHWTLVVVNGTIHKLYTSPTPQTNLFTGTDLLLITAEDASSSPVVPNTSSSDHYYYALITHANSAPSIFTIKKCPTGISNSASNPCS